MYARSRDRYMLVLPYWNLLVSSSLFHVEKYQECRAVVVKRGQSHVFLEKTRQNDKNLTRFGRNEAIWIGSKW